MDRLDLSSNWKQLQVQLARKQSAGSAELSQKEEVTASDQVRQPRVPNARSPKRKRELKPFRGVHQRLERSFKPAIWRPESKKQEKVKIEASSEPSAVISLAKGSEVLQTGEISAGMADDAARSVDVAMPSGTRASTEDSSRSSLGKFISIDTEMVGTPNSTAHSLAPHYTGTNGRRNDHSILARVSLVSHDLSTIYDAFVLPPSGTTISSYRTKYSGITSWHLKPDNDVTNPRPFSEVQAKVAKLIEGRVLVGHALSGDLKVLGLTHPRARVRDTSRHTKYRTLYSSGTIPPAPATVDGADRLAPAAGPEALVRGKGRTPSLKMLASTVLGWDIQSDDIKGHSSVEDAKAAMALFKAERTGFEEEARRLFGRGAMAVVETKRECVTPSGKGITMSLQNGDRVREAQEEDDAETEAEEDSVGGHEDERGRVVGERRAGEASRLPMTKRNAKKKKKKGKYRRT